MRQLLLSLPSLREGSRNSENKRGKFLSFEFKKRNRLGDRVPWLSRLGRDPREETEIRLSWGPCRTQSPRKVKGSEFQGDLCLPLPRGSGSGVEMAAREVTLQEVSESMGGFSFYRA